MRARVILAWVAVLGSVSAQSGWILRTPAVSPSARRWNLLTYDLSRSVTVLFSGALAPADTWEWNGANWAQRFPVTAPPARLGSAHGYDVIRARIVLFGGTAGATTLADTWEYDGTNWIQILPPVAPAARRLAGMAFDSVRGRMVLFGGGSDGIVGTLNLQGDMWDWNGATWTQLAPAHRPPARWSFGMTTDFANGRILVHGGSSTWGNVTPTFRDTWSWNGTDWTQIVTVVQPPALVGFGLAYSWLRGVPILFGGDPLSNETWLFAGNTWVRDVSPMSPGFQAGCTLAYDVFGGRTIFLANNGATWEYAAPDLARWLPYGAGCAGSAGAPLLRAVTMARPVLGTTFPLELVSVPSSGLAAITFGFSSATWSGGALPASLAPLGMPGCTLLADPQVVFAALIAGGRATHNWPLPNVAAFAGMQFYNQAIVLDPGINALGAVVSNAGAGVVGAL